MVRMLIDKGANVNAKVRDGIKESPLLALAIQHECDSILRELSTEAQTQTWRLALMKERLFHACYFNSDKNVGAIHYLAHKGADKGQADQKAR